MAKTIKEIEDDIHHFEAELGWVEERRQVLIATLAKLRVARNALLHTEPQDTNAPAARQPERP